MKTNAFIDAAAATRSQRPSLVRIGNRLIGPCLLALLCSGCFAWREVYSPGAKGVVIDSQSLSPVTQAKVGVSIVPGETLTVSNALLQLRHPIVHTDSTGWFEVPPGYTYNLALGIPWWPSHNTNGPPQFSGTLVVRHPGYESRAIPFRSHSVTNLGEVQLTPLAQ
jgi:hypothetical protein